jgi:hypothetical protein
LSERQWWRRRMQEEHRQSRGGAVLQAVSDWRLVVFSGGVRHWLQGGGSWGLPEGAAALAGYSSHRQAKQKAT